MRDIIPNPPAAVSRRFTDANGYRSAKEAAEAAWNRRAPSKGVPDNSMKVFEPSVQWVSNNTAAQSKEDKP